MYFDFLCCGEYIQVTAAYSNAVLLAVLPHFTDFTQKLELPVPVPISTTHVEKFTTEPVRDRIGGSVVLTNGFVFGFYRGHVTAFRSPHSFWDLQDPNDIPAFYGPLRMTEQEAVELARQYLRKLGYSLEDLCADFPPQVEMAQGIGTNVVPHYRIRWVTPRSDTATRVEINANRRVVEEIRFNRIVALERTDPKVNLKPGELPLGHPWRVLNESGRVNPAYAQKLVPYVFRAIEDWARKLAWNLPLPVTTNHVDRFYVSDQGGWPHCEVTFSNGWWFKFRNSGLTFAGSPRRFFDSDNLPFRIKDYVGKWKLSEEQAIDVARKAVAKLGHPKGFVHMEITPRVFRPAEIKGMPTIPRLQIEWNYPSLEQREQWIQVEVDCDKGTVESFSFDDASLWGKPPPIDVPISAKDAKKVIAPPSGRRPAQ